MKLKAMPLNTAISAGCPAPSHGKADRYEEKRRWRRKRPGTFRQRRQHREFDDRRDNDADGGGQRECKGAAVGQIAFRRQQQDHDGDEHDRRGAVRPGGGDPEKLDRTDRDERACRIDEQPAANRRRLAGQSRCPAGGRPGHRRAAPIRRARAACRQAPWPFRRRAAAAMACRPAGRAAFAPPPRKRAAGLKDRQSSASASLAPTPIAARRDAASGWLPPPAGPRRPASVSDVLATPRQPSSAANRPCTAVCNVDDVVAHVAGLSERLVDHRVERDDAPDEVRVARLACPAVAAPPAPACG